MSWTRIVAAGYSRHVRHTALLPPATAAMTTMLSTPLTLLSHSTTNTTSQRTWANATSTRAFSTTTPLDEFRDAVTRQKRMAEPVGRSWTVKELRRKSFEDLHKLWYVLYKERNMLFTEQQLSRRKGIIFPQPERVKKVRKSMGAIKQVLGERKREKLAGLALDQMNEADRMDGEFRGDEEEHDEEETESLEKR